MKAAIGIIVALLVIGGGIGLVFLGRDDTKPTTTQETTSSEQTTDLTEQPTEETQATEENTEVATSNVNIQNSSYSPAAITVKKGTTVTWTNKDSTQHDVMPDAESANFIGSNGLLSQGATYSFTFNVAGTYTYHCTPHPFMKGTVIVTE